MLNITIWSDFSCPFCYFGEQHLELAIKNLRLEDEVDIEYRAYELNPDMPKDLVETATEHFMISGNITMEHAIGRINKISRIAEDAGVDFNYPAAKYCNTFDAHRLVKFAQATDKSTVRPLIRTIFEAFFVKGLVISDHEVLVDLASQVGLESAMVRNMLESNRFATEVTSDEQAAEIQDVESIPYTIFGNRQNVSGALSVENYEKAITATMNHMASASIVFV